MKEKDSNRFYVYAYLRDSDSEISPAGTPYYIGKGEGRRRFKKHRKGVDPPEKEERNVIIKEGLSCEEALFEEMYLIDVYGRVDIGTGILRNMTDGGDGVKNPSPESIAKAVLKNTGRKQPRDAVERTSEANRGKKRPIEAIVLVAEKNRGSKRTKEQRDNMSKAQTLRFSQNPVSPETRERLSKAGIGRTMSPESIEKTASWLRGRPKSEEHKKNLRKPKSEQGKANMRSGWAKRLERLAREKEQNDSLSKPQG